MNWAGGGRYNSTFNIKGNASVKGSKERAGQVGRAIKGGVRCCRPPYSLRKSRESIGASLRQSQVDKEFCLPRMGLP